MTLAKLLVVLGSLLLTGCFSLGTPKEIELMSVTSRIEHGSAIETAERLNAAFVASRATVDSPACTCLPDEADGLDRAHAAIWFEATGEHELVLRMDHADEWDLQALMRLTDQLRDLGEPSGTKTRTRWTEDGTEYTAVHSTSSTP